MSSLSPFFERAYLFPERQKNMIRGGGEWIGYINMGGDAGGTMMCPIKPCLPLIQSSRLHESSPATHRPPTRPIRPITAFDHQFDKESADRQINTYSLVGTVPVTGRQLERVVTGYTDILNTAGSFSDFTDSGTRSSILATLVCRQNRDTRSTAPPIVS